MFSNNITKFLLNLVQDGSVAMNFEDEIISDTLVTHDGELVKTYTTRYGIISTEQIVDVGGRKVLARCVFE